MTNIAIKTEQRVIPDNRGILSKLFQSPPTIAELTKDEFVAYRAVTQRQRACREWRTR